MSRAITKQSTALAEAPSALSDPLERIPFDQLDLFTQETRRAQSHVLKWIAILDPLRDKKNRGALFQQIAGHLSMSEGAVRKRYYRYLDGVNGKVSPVWEGIIDRRKFPVPKVKALPTSFIDHWKGLLEQYQRDDSGKQAHRALLAQLDRWIKGDASDRIPGYDAPPVLDSHCREARRRVPRGWSYRNLIDHKPRAFNLVSSRQGPKKAAELLPSNYGTRAGLRFLERVFFDDQEYDQKVRIDHGNSGKLMRPLGFNALDHLTGAFLDYSIKLARWDDEAGVRRQLTQKLFVWQVLSVLMRVGFRTDSTGTTFVFEHGSATGYAERDDMQGRSFDSVLSSVTNGCVSVDRSGRFDQPFLAQALFRGKGKQASGNPRFKAPLESMFHLVRTMSSGLLGQTGSNQRLNGPEGDAKLDSYTRQVQKAIGNLPRERQARAWELVQLPYHTFGEFVDLMNLVYSAINNREDHKLEGWENAGFVNHGFKVDLLGNGGETFVSREQFMELEPARQAAIESVAKTHSMRLSPTQAARLANKREQPKIARLNEAHIPLVIPPSDDWTYQVTVNRKGEFKFTDRLNFGSEPLIFIASVEDQHGRRDLRPGSEYRGYLNPYHPDRLVVTDLDGRFLGGCDRFEPYAAGDKAGAYRNQAKINAYRKRIGAPMERRASKLADEMAGMVENNERLISGEPVTPEEIAEENANAKRRRQAVKAIESETGEDVTSIFGFDPEIDDQI